METREAPPGVTLVGVPRGRVPEVLSGILTRVVPGTHTIVSRNPRDLFRILHVPLPEAMGLPPAPRFLVLVHGDIFWVKTGLKELLLDVARTAEGKGALPAIIVLAEVLRPEDLYALQASLGGLATYLNNVSYEDFHG